MSRLSPPRTRPWAGLALALILLLAAGLRLAGDDWDQRQHLNVDEYFITKVTTRQVRWPADAALTALLDPATSTLNPRIGGAQYPYGTLPLYLTKAVTNALAGLTGNAAFTSFDGTLMTGRALAGLLDTLTTLLIFLLGRRLWGTGAGLGAAALYAFAILPLHTSHFYISDAFMAAFLTAALLGSVVFVQTGRAWVLAGAGLAVGLAMACKLTAAPMLLLPLAAIAGWGLGAGGWRRWPRRRMVGVALGLAALVGVLAGLGLLIGDPFGVLDAPTYLAQVREQAAIQSGADDVWFTRKYVGTWPLLYP